VTTLHITNGDCAAGTLRSFLSDPVLVTCDVLHDGPAPLVDGDAWHETRARFLTDAVEASYDETRASLARFDRTLVDAAADDEIVLWFEHDLFDQLLLIRTLDLLVRLKADTTYESDPAWAVTPGEIPPYVVSAFRRTSVSLICIGEFPGVERFVGLGQLNAEQLASLYPARQPAGAEQFALASEAWRAFRASDPRELLALMARLRTDASEALPFLHGAIQRLFEEYPSTANGLSRSADAVLRALESGPLDGTALFRATQWGEQRPFMGDLGLFDIVRRLATARVPLVAIDAGTSALHLRDCTVRVTDAGREVLAGRLDAVGLNGIDEWRGGVHLVGRDRSPWRWDPHGETLVS
jgi:hypothetical protein